jgi:hypothetical protein
MRWPAATGSGWLGAFFFCPFCLSLGKLTAPVERLSAGPGPHLAARIPSDNNDWEQCANAAQFFFEASSLCVSRVLSPSSFWALHRPPSFARPAYCRPRLVVVSRRMAGANCLSEQQTEPSRIPGSGALGRLRYPPAGSGRLLYARLPQTSLPTTPAVVTLVTGLTWPSLVTETVMTTSQSHGVPDTMTLTIPVPPRDSSPPSSVEALSPRSIIEADVCEFGPFRRSSPRNLPSQVHLS